jgi:uncharacterized phage-associated protein
MNDVAPTGDPPAGVGRAAGAVAYPSRSTGDTSLTGGIAMAVSYAEAAQQAATPGEAPPEGVARMADDIRDTPVSAHHVAAVLRERLPGVPTKKLHKLLYYCQGHHLAAFGQPLFTETISAWDMGPVIGTLWFREDRRDPPPPRRDLTEAQLNTIGYVISRYGALTGRDLETLTHSESPWRLADRGRRPGESARIEREWIRDYFVADHEEEDPYPLDSASVTRWLEDAPTRRPEFVRPDSPEEIQARLAASVQPKA